MLPNNLLYGCESATDATRESSAFVWLEEQMVDVGELTTVQVLQAAKANWSVVVPLALVEKLFTLNEKQGVAFQIAA